MDMAYHQALLEVSVRKRLCEAHILLQGLFKHIERMKDAARRRDLDPCSVKNIKRLHSYASKTIDHYCDLQKHASWVEQSYLALPMQHRNALSRQRTAFRKAYNIEGMYPPACGYRCPYPSETARRPVFRPDESDFWLPIIAGMPYEIVRSGPGTIKALVRADMPEEVERCHWNNDVITGVAEETPEEAERLKKLNINVGNQTNLDDGDRRIYRLRPAVMNPQRAAPGWRLDAATWRNGDQNLMEADRKLARRHNVLVRQASQPSGKLQVNRSEVKLTKQRANAVADHHQAYKNVSIKEKSNQPVEPPHHPPRRRSILQKRLDEEDHKGMAPSTEKSEQPGASACASIALN
ncbi:hypothetical protein H2203_000111 [Taxawa tesnikishii (nom. ined.)]|nr:hypothetical protein H2203_000111 [Dothideales sp. JES 119]